MPNPSNWPDNNSFMLNLRLTYLLLLIAFATQVNAVSLGYTNERKLTFGIDMDYAPLEFVDERGVPHGVDVEFTRLLMNRLAIPFTYSPNTWENIADDVIKGKVDLAMMVYSPYRKDLTNYSRAVFRLYYQIVYRKTDRTPHGLRDLSGKEVAFMMSRPLLDTLQKIGAKPIVVNNLNKTFRALSKGRYDAVICFRYQALYLIDNSELFGLSSSDLALMPREYCYVSNNKELIDVINNELDKMEQEGVIEDVYGNVRASFDEFRIPWWVWLLIAGVIILSLITIIVQQRISRKKILEEMARAKKSEELKDIFLSNLSHSLRTPLNAIIGFSDLLLTTPQEEIKEEERNKLLEIVNSNGLQLLHLINELLSLSDIEGNNQLFNLQVTDIDAEMTSYAAETRMQMTDGVVLDVVEPVDGLRALTDKKLLRLVVMQLLENARQHTTRGSIILSYYAKEDGLYVEVKDTGSGLPEKLKENIFALLSDKNTYIQEDTPGLGLSICKAIVDKANGKIGFRDNDIDGQGSIFWFWLSVEIL